MEVTQQERNRVVKRYLLKLSERYPGMQHHFERVAVYAVAMGGQLLLSSEELLSLKEAAMLYCAGLLVDFNLLRISERDVIEGHMLYADRVLKEDFLKPAVKMIFHQKEQWNGLGVPEGLFMEQIPIGSRIISWVSAFDRAFERALQLESEEHQEIDKCKLAYKFAKQEFIQTQTLNELKTLSGVKYDPKAIAAFESIYLRIQPLF